MVARIMNDSQEDEMTKNLDEVSSIISSLKVIAEDVGSTVDKSNKQIDKLLGLVNGACYLWLFVIYQVDFYRHQRNMSI